MVVQSCLTGPGRPPPPFRPRPSPPPPAEFLSRFSSMGFWSSASLPSSSSLLSSSFSIPTSSLWSPRPPPPPHDAGECGVGPGLEVLLAQRGEVRPQEHHLAAWKVHCTALHCTALHAPQLHCTAICYSVVQRQKAKGDAGQCRVE